MTLLPNKYIPSSHSLVGIGAMLLRHMERPTSVSRLWELTKNEPGVVTYENFVLSLDYLFAIGTIDYQHGLIVRSTL